MLISEIYRSVQGEGLLTGTPSVFVRTSGCNLRCGFCDTPFASWEPVGQSLSIDAIMSQIQSAAQSSENTCIANAPAMIPGPVQHVVITGGEPFLPREIIELCQRVSSAKFHVTVETAGTMYRSLACNLMSISPKLSNSDPEAGRAGEWREKHRAARLRPNVVRRLMAEHPYQLKFVVDRPDDLDEILDYLEKIKPFDQSRVLLMPQGIDQSELEDRARWLIPMCESHGFCFSPRRHIEWFGNERGT